MNSDKQVVVGGSAISYHAFVEKLIKKFPGENGTALEYMHAAVGVCGEAGELADALKRVAIYGKELDRKNLVEELGDISFFIQDIQNKFFISDNEILQSNADKLADRYKGLVYSDQAAILREDKIELSAEEAAYETGTEFIQDSERPGVIRAADTGRDVTHGGQP